MSNHFTFWGFLSDVRRVDLDIVLIIQPPKTKLTEYPVEYFPAYSYYRVFISDDEKRDKFFVQWSKLREHRVMFTADDSGMEFQLLE